MAATRSDRVREAIVAAAVAIAATDGVPAITHRRLAAAADVSLSSTTWHFATKTDILVAALRWTARREVERIEAIADRLGEFDLRAWSDELADWVVEQVTAEREVTVALYRLQIELLGRPQAAEVHREWGDALRALGERVSPASALDTGLVVAALDGLRLAALSADDAEWVRPAVHRLLHALLGE